MDEKVKVKFMRYKNVVLMEVLEMPEKHRDKGLLINSEQASIHSICKPEVRNSTLYLRGEKKKFDNDCCAYVYSTTAEALEAIKKFSDLIHELNERDAEKPEKTSDGEFEITIAE